MIEAGLLLGLSREVSTKLVVQTMFGSALLLRDEGIHPVELRETVTSPGGTTTRAIQELERSGVRAAFLNAISAATERSRARARREARLRSASLLRAWKKRRASLPSGCPLSQADLPMPAVVATWPTVFSVGKS